MKRALAVVALILPAVGCAGSGAPDSLREWKDAEGRVIGRLEGDGRTTLLWWDVAEGRVVRMAGLEGERESWVHLFAYEGGRLAREVDCVGHEHVLSPGRSVDLARGTALLNHRHLDEAPYAQPGVFTYDDAGRVASEERP
jgi:YD repeat-containing protein